MISDLNGPTNEFKLETMKAIVYHKYGPPDVPKLEEVKKPIIK